MNLKHRTTDPFDRFPQGALPAKTQVTLRVHVTGASAPTVALRVWNGQEHRYPMRCLGLREGELLFEAQIPVSETPCLYWYRFEARQEQDYAICGAPPDGTGCGEGVTGSEESFQITVYDPDYAPPAWMREGIMYQIMPDRFFHGEGTDALLRAKKGQRIVIHKSWDETPALNVGESSDNFANDFFGGNLEGVRQKLPYLKELGVSVIYFNPIFLSPSNHKYDTSDYMQVDPMFGDEAALRRLCEDARAMGIRVMLDGVFSHVGDDSIYFNRRGTHGEHVGAYRDPQSPYRKWFTFKHWPDDYECWWNFKTLPNVNEMDEDYRRVLLSGEDAVVKHYIRAGTSGWRLDVADELPMPFLRELRCAVKQTDPQAAVLGEVWEDASHKVSYGQMRSYVLGDTLDSVMNYPLREDLIDFLKNKISAGTAAKALTALAQNYPKPFLYSVMNLMGSHDRPRILNVLACSDGEDLPREQRAAHRLSPEARMIGALREQLMLRMVVSVPGMPCVYYGDEAGMEGCADPFCRGTYPWGREDTAILSGYKTLLAMRRANPVLRTGDCRYIAPSDDILGVIRVIRGGRDVFDQPARNAAAVTLINRSARAADVYLTQEELQGAKALIADDGERVTAQAGAFTVHLKGLRGRTLFAKL